MQLGSIMKQHFSNVSSANIPRSVFPFYKRHKTTIDEDYLIPFWCTLLGTPGDTYNQGSFDEPLYEG